jgi:iron complex transport system substrate-binding protein
VEASLRALGEALGVPARAEAVVAQVEAARVRARARAKARGRAPTVLLVYGFHPLVVAGPGSFAHELLTDCGATNLAEAAPTAYPVYSVERVVALGPDLLIDASDGMEGPKAWADVPKLKALKVVRLPSRELLHPGPALPQGLAALSDLLDAAVAGDAGAR